MIPAAGGGGGYKIIQKFYWYGLDGNSVDDVTAGCCVYNSPTDEYVFFAGRRITHLDPSHNVYYMFSDSLGSTRVVTDSSGNTCYDADFYPYGGEIAFTDICDQPYKFTGYERDKESGNDFAKFRFYNNRAGRFMSTDPIGGNPVNPQSWNAYSFVLNNPANLTDPLGLDGNDPNDPNVVVYPGPGGSGYGGYWGGPWDYIGLAGVNPVVYSYITESRII